ncbi:MAG: hypothetical protein AB1640_07280 [bacterium]
MPDFKVSRAYLAAVFQVSPSTVSRWTKDGLERDPDGRFDIRAAVEWALERARGTAAEHTDESEEGQRWLTALRRERALLVGLERRQREGELLPRTEIEKGHVDRILELKRSLFLLSRRIGHRVAVGSEQKLKDVVAVVDAEVRLFLEAYSRPLPAAGHMIQGKAPEEGRHEDQVGSGGT